MPQKTTDWIPNPKQSAVLEAAQEAGLNRSISAICEVAGVDRKSFYNWMKKDDEFKAAGIGRQLRGDGSIGVKTPI